MTDRRHQRGADGEQTAAQELERRGYRIVERNYRCRQGEIDIVAEHDDMLCFVEVRTRRSQASVDGLASVDWSKRRRLCRAAQRYIQQRKVGERAMRFDVVSVQADADALTVVEVIRNAFDATGQV